MPRRQIRDSLQYREYQHAVHFQGNRREQEQQECLLIVLSAEGMSLLTAMESQMPGTVAVVRRDLTKLVKKARRKGLL